MNYHTVCIYSVIFFQFFLHRNGNCKTCGDLYLTVSAVTNLLEFNWNFKENCETPPDTLTILYRTAINNSKDLETISIKGKLEGYHRSQIQFGKPQYPGNWNKNGNIPVLRSSMCYPFWIESKLNGNTIDTACIKIEPSWMKRFGKLRIGSMMIPGTHNSGAWRGSLFPSINKYLLTQEHNLWGQLLSGIRYFDIRVGLYQSQAIKEWINHGIFRCSKMREEFKHLANFLETSPTEVVILHMKSFEHPKNFTNADHQVILDLLQEILGKYILPRSYFYDKNGPTLQEIWETNRTLIVSYNDKYIVQKNSWLWHEIEHKWGDETTVADLYDYLSEVRNNHVHPESPFCALMTELTPNAEFIINNFDKSLRHMADEVNPKLNFWLRQEKWSDDVNIVATDFFLGNDVISISIEANSKKLLNTIPATVG